MARSAGLAQTVDQSLGVWECCGLCLATDGGADEGRLDGG